MQLVACATQTPCTNASRFITAFPKMTSLGLTLQAKEGPDVQAR